MNHRTRIENARGIPFNKLMQRFFIILTITGICLALIIFVWDNADYLDTRERIGFEVLGAIFLSAYGIKWFVNRIRE